jgi:anaerobic ribonucleoside-triphosphate reductase
MPKTDTSVDSEQAKDDRLLGQLEENCEKLTKIIDIAHYIFTQGAANDRMYQTVDMLIKATEQHRKVALTIHNIRHPKSTIFVKNQVNQLQLKTDKLQQQIEGTKNAKMDTSSQKKTETIDIKAQTLA